jgi:hypothetical protein
LTELHIREFTFADAPQVMALQQAHAAIYAGAEVIPAEVYAGPGFEAGRNIFCAWLADGRLAGYAPLYPVLALDDGPHILWTEIRVDPALADAEDVRRTLLNCLVDRAREIAAPVAGHACQLTF